MTRKDKKDLWQPVVGILPDGEVKHVLIDPAGWVFEDPTRKPSEYDTLMMALRVMADAREIRMNAADEIGNRVAVLDGGGVVRYIKLDYVTKLSSEEYRMIELQAVNNDTLITVTAKGRYWLEQWIKRKREYTPQ